MRNVESRANGWQAGPSASTAGLFDDILTLVAHDLKNPLTCIEGYASLLLEDGLTKENREKALRRILSCCRWAGAIVSDLMDAKAIEQGGFTLSKSLVSLEEVVRTAVEDLQVVCQRKAVVVHVQIAPGAGRVLADPVRIRQVVNNLLANALKHVSFAGRISASLSESAAGELVVSIADNGTGIDPAHQSKIFEKFYQASYESRGNLGLGLFISKVIVELHGGRIWVYSEGLGHGATFHFSLPQYQPERAYDGFKAWRSQDTPPPRPA